MYVTVPLSTGEMLEIFRKIDTGGNGGVAFVIPLVFTVTAATAAVSRTATNNYYILCYNCVYFNTLVTAPHTLL